jgi:hypothetical protein
LMQALQQAAHAAFAGGNAAREADAALGQVAPRQDGYS